MRAGIEGAMKYIFFFKGWPKVITRRRGKLAKICILQEEFEFAFYNECKQKVLVLIRTSVEDNSENIRDSETKKKNIPYSRCEIF